MKSFSILPLFLLYLVSLVVARGGGGGSHSSHRYKRDLADLDSFDARDVEESSFLEAREFEDELDARSEVLADLTERELIDELADRLERRRVPVYGGSRLGIRGVFPMFKLPGFLGSNFPRPPFGRRPRRPFY